MTDKRLKTRVLSVEIDPIDLQTAAGHIERTISLRKSGYVSLCNVYTIMCSQSDFRLRNFINRADLVLPDGMPIVWIARSRGFEGVERVYGPELMLELCGRSASRSYRHFLYGSTQETLDRLQDRLGQKFADLQIVGAISPPFDLNDPEQDIKAINDVAPDIVWVALGTPKQDYWVAENAPRLPGALLIPVGAAFDFLAGTKAQAPRWLQQNGLEWAFRLATEPRRLWKRYLIYNPWFLYKLGVEAVRNR